ncbi:MAG TPA: hypothetical protein VK471_06185 [Solirubrobacterales bacterium]|nr:hypothetical protein [Solirubrobacterales bacterium]
MSRQVPVTAFGGEIWGRFAADITLPGPLREAPIETPPTPTPNVARETANG